MKTFHHVGHKPFEEPKSVIFGNQRWYATPSGNRYPSVTTVTGFRKARFFAEWRANNPQEAKRTADRGTLLHHMVEKYVQNQWEDGTKLASLADNPAERSSYMLVDDLFSQMQPILDQHLDNIKAQEVGLWSDRLRLAGRCDCIADWDGIPSIIDFKGSTKPKRGEDIDNYFMQAAAYAVMWQEIVGEPICNIVIVLSSESSPVPQVFRERTIRWIPPLLDIRKEFDREESVDGIDGQSSRDSADLVAGDGDRAVRS